MFKDLDFMFPLAEKRSKDKFIPIESDEIGPAMAALRSDYSGSRSPGKVTELRKLSVQQLHGPREI